MIPSEHDFTLFEQALGVPTASRDAFIARRASSRAQRESVERLLRLAESDSFLDDTAAEVFPELLIPTGFEEIGFQIVRELGRGGMGVVYLARDMRLDRFAALKVLAADTLAPRTSEERFRREARAIARLDHPGIVPVYQTGTFEGAVYIVTAYVEGETLADLIANQAEDGFASPSWHWQVAGLVGDLARAVEYAHRNGVIHRDIKPSNVLINEHGSPHLVDFGVAKVTEAPVVTRDGEYPGSLAYMSPEQLGDVKAPVGAASDVFALGLVLFECLCGRRLRPGSTPAEVTADLDPEPGRTLLGLQPRVPGSLALVCDRALRRSPEDRYASAAELANELEAAARGELAVARVSLAPIRRLWRRRPKLIVAGASVLIATGLTAAVASIRLPVKGTIRLSAVSGTKSASISVRPIDEETRVPGPRQVLGSTPLRWRVAPGLYRVEASTEDGVQEFTRGVTRDKVIDIAVGPLQHGVEATEMVYVEGGEYIVGHAMSAGSMSQRRVTVEPFWIDRHEVTNAQYRRFVEGTGRASPATWLEPYDSTWDSLPVVGVSLEDARAYAEWVGKRLPTDTEWESAAAGIDSLSYPWGSTFDDAALPDVDATSAAHAWSRDVGKPEVRTSYLAGVRAVGASPIDGSPSGMLDAFGNVMEWTESVTEVSVPDEGTVAQVIIKGRWWGDRAPDRWSLQDYVFAHPSTRRANLGFRCAKSAFPSE